MPRHHDRSRSRRRRPFRKTRRPARRAAVERLEPRRLLSTTPLGVNVVQNPGAEQGYDHWQADGTAMAVVGYGGFNVPAPANAPPNGGQNLWYGGERESFASLYQVLDFNFPESLIDSGSLSVDASAWLGSAEDNVERGVMTVWFRGPTFNDVIATSPIFGPSISERGGRTELQFRDEEIAIPPGTRHVSVSIESKWPGGYSEQTGVNADGSVDNVSVSYKLGAGSGGDSDNWVIPGDADFGDVPFTLQLPAGVAVSYDGDLSGAGLSVSGDPSGGNVVSFTGALNLPALNLDSVDASLKSTASINNTDIVVGTGSLAIGNGVPLSVSGSSSVRAAAASLITGNGGTPADVNGSLFSLQIDALASLNPGNSPGIFYAGNTQLESGSTLIVELHGPVAGFSYDQLDVAGTVALGGSSLTVDLQYDPADGQEFVIVDNDGTDAVSGTFSGLPEGSAFLVDGKRFFITYSGGDGNDVVLRRNRQPVSAFETRTVAEDVLLEAVVSAVDPDGDGMTFSVETPPAHAASFSLNSDGTFTYQADEHFSGSDSFRYVANDGDRQAVLTQEIEVTAVADEPLLSVTAASGDEGTPIPLAIAPQLVDADGSESLSVLLGGIPENTLLNRGTRDPLTGDWTVDPADLTDLTIESPDNQAFELSVAVTATEGANAAAATISDTLQVTVNNVAPTLTYTDQIAGSQQLRSWTNLVTITDPGYADPAQGTTETFTYTINWGDGTATDTGAASVDATGGPPAGGEPSTLTGASFDASHTYAEDGRYTVTVTVTDDDGGTASAVFEVRVMLRLLDVSYSSETATLNFTDPVDPATVTHSSVRLMGSQSGLLNDDTADFTVTGATVTVPLLHRAFAGETLTVILPADRDEAAKPGVWSVRANPIYEPEIDRQIAAATAGTGNFVQTSIDLSGPNPTSSYPLLADFNRDGYLDYLDEFALMTRSPDAWHWESISWNDESFLPDVYAADSDGDGVLEAVPGNLVADFDLDGEPEELTYEGIFSNFHLDGQAVNPLVWPDGRGRAWDNQLVAGDYDGDGDVDVLAAAWYWGSSHSWLWLNPTRNPSPDGVTLREFSISGFRDDAYAGGSDDGFISADLNGDGRDDLVANRSNAVMVALAPTDDWTTSEEIVWAESISFRDDGPNSPDGHTALDFDGDGDLDLAIDYYSSWERGLSGTHLYANDGHGNFSLVSVLSEIRGLTAADVNNDGAIDLVGGWSTDEDGPPVLLNSPAGTSAQVGEFEQFAASRGAFAFDELFDFEGTTGVTASHSGRTTTVWNRNSGSWTEAASFSLEKPPGVRGIDRLAATEGSVVTVDVTSNGSSDYDISLRFYDRAGDGTWSESTPHTFVGMSTSALQVDIDGDVAVLSIGPSVYTFEKTASGNWSERTDLRFDAEDLYSYTRSIQVSEDWLFVYNSHGVQVYRRTEAGWARHGGIDDYYHGLRYAVSYSDGRLAVGERDGYDTTVSIYTTADHATWFLEQRLSSSTGGASFALSGDVIAIGDHDHNSVQLYRFGADGWQADTLLECPAPRDPPPAYRLTKILGLSTLTAVNSGLPRQETIRFVAVLGRCSAGRPTALPSRIGGQPSPRSMTFGPRATPPKSPLTSRESPAAGRRTSRCG